MWQTVLRIFIVILALNLHADVALAVDSPAWVSHHLDLGQRFYAARDFDRSAEEYERATILLGPTAPLSLQLRLAESYYRGAHYSEAQAVISGRLSAVLAAPCFLAGGNTQDAGVATDPAACLDAKLLLAKSLMHMDAYQTAEATLSAVVTERESVSEGEGAKARDHDSSGVAAKLIRARLLLGTTRAAQSRFDDAIVQYQAVAAAQLENPIYSQVAKSSVTLIRAFEAEKPHNSRVASLLAIIPGLGHAYCGEYAVAASSLIVNSALFYLTLDSWKKSQKIPGYSPATAVGWGTLAATFYTANIYSAGEMAHRKTDDRRAKLRRSLQELNLGDDGSF